MSNKPELKEVLAIYKMKNDATALFDEIDKRVKAIQEVFGANRFDYDLGISGGTDGKQYLKFEITDNVKKLEDGEIVWKSTPFKPTSYALLPLKTCPKSLK